MRVEEVAGFIRAGSRAEVERRLARRRRRLAERVARAEKNLERKGSANYPRG